MNHYCCVPQCSSWAKKNPEYSFHTFPKAGKSRVTITTKSGNKVLMDRRDVWINNLKIRRKVSEYMKVCSLHFIDSDYFPKACSNNRKRRILKSNSVPTKKLPLVPDCGDDLITILSKTHGGNVSKDKFEVQPEPISVKPLGDDLLRVCRTCFQIMKIEEAVPLELSISGLFVETKLCLRLKSILQVDLFDVENPCLCKKCEAFINAVDSFRSTCWANEEVLRDFDWDCKTPNLLCVVDQDKLMSSYNQVKSGVIEEIVATSLTEDQDLSEKLLERDVRRNGLSDMKNYLHSTNTIGNWKDNDSTSSPEPSCSTSLPKDQNLLSPNCNRYSDKLQNRVRQKLTKRCRCYHNKNESNGSFLCELCRKVKVSMPAFYRHMRFHRSSNCFSCIKCNKMLYERLCYLKHCKTVRGSCPRTLTSPRCPKMYLYKKHFDKIPIKTKHSNRNISRVAGEKLIFQCSLCKRSYTKIGCFELHQKYCNGDMCLKVLRLS